MKILKSLVMGIVAIQLCEWIYHGWRRQPYTCFTCGHTTPYDVSVDVLSRALPRWELCEGCYTDHYLGARP